MFIAVALGLIVGGLVFYQQASRAATYQGVVRGLQAVQGELRALYEVTGWQNTGAQVPNDITATLIAMEAVPREMVNDAGTQIVLSSGIVMNVQYAMAGDGLGLGYQIFGMPVWLCTRLIPANQNGEGLGEGVLSDLETITVRSVVGAFGPTGISLTHDFRTAGNLTPGIAADFCTRAEAAPPRLGIIVDVRSKL